MSLLDQLSAGVARRSVGTSGISSPASWLFDVLGADETYSGKQVSPNTAMTLVPVYSAITLVAGAVGSLPLVTYKRLDAGRERAPGSDRVYRLLHDSPNDLMAADEFWEIITAHLLLWGNAFAAKGRGANGLVNELIPLRPDQVRVGWDPKTKQPFYVYTDPVTGRELVGSPDDVLHFRGLGSDGRIGFSPIQLARQAIGNQLAQEEFAGRFWQNNARPGGLLKHPSTLTPKAEKRLRSSWEAVQGGLANAGRTAILEEGMEWQSLSMPLADAQFIEQAKYGRSEVALLFRVPPHMLAAEGGGTSLTYSTVEGESLDFVKWSLRRWLTRIEGTCKRDPDLYREDGPFYPEFLVDALLRGDSVSRADVYQKALDPVRGWLDVDEVRDMENRNPLTAEQRKARLELAAVAKTAATPSTKRRGTKEEDTP